MEKFKSEHVATVTQKLKKISFFDFLYLQLQNKLKVIETEPVKIVNFFSI